MTQPLDHQVVWFDIPVRDLDRAIRFYSAVLGAPLQREVAGPGMDLAVLPHGQNTVGGCLVQRSGDEPGRQGPLLYLNVKGRLDEAIAAAGKHGGRVTEPKHSIAPHGFRAVVLDSEGNRIALHST
jgi:predicted enzyme related to lactoylglutathione lyase